MALVVKGTPDFRDGPLSPLFSVPKLSFLGVSRRRSPYSGEQWVITYEGPASNNPEEPSAAEVGYSLVPIDFEANLEAIGPIYRLTVISPDFPQGGSYGVQQTNFELLGNTQQKDIREHPFALTIGTTLAKSAAVVYEIDSAIDNNRQPDLSTATFPGIDTTKANDLNVRLRQRKGSMAFQVSQYALRWTRIASNRASVDVVFPNVHRVYTTAQLIAETGPPTGILASVEDAATQFESESTDITEHVYGWLKQTPTVTQMAGNKVQIVNEYWLEQWDCPRVYAAAT